MASGYVTSTRSLPYSQKEEVPTPLPGSLFIPNEIKANGDFTGSQKTISFRTNGYTDDDPQRVDRHYLAEYASEQSNKFFRPYDNGHEFFTEKSFYRLSHPNFRFFVGNRGFEGPLRTAFGKVDFPLPSVDKNYYGNKAISTLSPTVSRASLLQDTGELIKDGFVLTGGSGLADWLQSRTHLARAAGSEYLNVTFGWVPTINALIKTVTSLQNATKIMTDLRYNSGKFVRRRMSFPVIDTSSASTFVGAGINVGTGGSNIEGSYWNFLYEGGTSGRETTFLTNRRTYQEIWFSGAFMFYLNPGDSLVDKLQRYEQLANKVLGTRLTPDVLWELAPWSWLVDWVVDIQHALQAATLLQSDGLVLKYGYLMRKTIRSQETSTQVTFKGMQPITVSNLNVITTKERFRSTPFGFGLNPNSFTDRQWAILGALGLSLGPRSLY